VFALSIAELPLCFPNSGDKTSAEKRVKELEEALATQVAESKKATDAAQRSAAVREKASNVRGNLLFLFVLPVYPLGIMY